MDTLIAHWIGGKLLTARDVDGRVGMSNGATGVFLDVVALAGSARAATPWQQQLTLYVCDSERMGYGTSGFDLAEVPWTVDWMAEKDFFLQTIDLAAARHGWDKLHYDPPHARDHLSAYRDMLDSFTPQPVTGSWMGDWTRPPKAHEVDLCARHGVFRGEYECRLCDVSIQPIGAPKVWELISSQDTDGRLTYREVRQIPEEGLPELRPLFDFGTLSPAAHDKPDLEKMLAWKPVEPSLSDHVETILGTTLDPTLNHVIRIAVA